MAADCGVCCSPFTGTQRRRVECPYCQFPACLQCVQRHLLSSLAEPRCMAAECRRAWLRDFLDACVPLTWLRTKFRDHRRAVLLDRERSLLPATAQTAARVRAFRQDAGRVREALDAYRDICGRLLAQRSRVVDICVDLTGGAAGILARVHRALPFDAVRREIDNAEEAVRVMAADTDRIMAYVPFADRAPGTLLSATSGGGAEAGPDPGAPAPAPAPPGGERQIVCACPAPACRGYIETSTGTHGARLACGLCGTRVCGQCREIRDDDDDNDNDNAHVCHPDTLATIRLLARDSKACPQCRAMIFRTEGCHQMFCTVCHVSFCWRTLEILTGPVHNPHYFEWRRSANANANPNASAAPACADVLLRQRMSSERFLAHHLRRHLAQALIARSAPEPDHAPPTASIAVILCAEQFVNHTRAFLSNQYRVQPLERRNLDLRVQYLLGELDEDAWKVRLQRDERAHARHAEMLMVWQAFWLAAEEMLAAACGDLDARLQALDEISSAANGGGGAFRYDPSRAVVALLDLGTGWHPGAASRFLSLTGEEDEELGTCARGHAGRLLDLIDYTNQSQHRAAVRFACRYPRIAVVVERHGHGLDTPRRNGVPNHHCRLATVSTVHSEAPRPARESFAQSPVLVP